MSKPNDNGLTDAEIGLVDAVTTVTEILLALGVPSETLAQPFVLQRDAHRRAGRVNAAVALDLLVDYVRDKDRAKRRQILRIASQEPKGRA